MRSMRTKTYTLPCGYREKGELHAVVEIGEMTGEVQSEMARAENRGDQTKAMKIAFEWCVKKLGSVDLEKKKTEKDGTEKLLGFMLSPDQDYMIFHAMRGWKDTKIKGSLQCVGCKKILTAEADLSHFRKYVLRETYEAIKDQASADDACEVEVLEGVELVQDKASLTSSHCFKVKNSDYEVDAVFRLPYGFDSEKIAIEAKKNAVDAKHLLFAKTCLEWDGKPGVFTKEEFARLPYEILDWLFDEIRDNTPGLAPHDLSIVCEPCDIKNVPVLSDFLPGARSRARRLSTAK